MPDQNAILTVLQNDIVKSTVLLLIGGASGAFGAWWKGRERYQAHVTWQTHNGMHGPQEYPVLVIQSIHELPINVTHVRIRNGFRWNTGLWAFDSEDPDYPVMPRAIAPKGVTTFTLGEQALNKAARQGGRLLRWLWVPRVYVGVQTMGRGERLFVAESGLSYDQRRRRYRR